MSLLELKNLTRNFGGVKAVNQVNLTIEDHEFLGIIGPNGAGKTTLFNLITGFMPAHEGTVLYKKIDITNFEPNKICKLGLVRTFQITKPFGNITTKKNVMIGAFNRTSNVSEASNIADQALEATMLLKQKDVCAKNLSVPERKRLELARAIATEPELLLLDEPMSGLLPSEVEEMKKYLIKIWEQGITVIIIEHVLQAVMTLSSRIAVLDYGEKIAEGNPVEIGKNPKVIEAYFGEEYVIT